MPIFAPQDVVVTNGPFEPSFEISDSVSIFMSDFSKILLSTDRPLMTLGVFLELIMIAESLFIIWLELRFSGMPIHSTQVHTFSFLVLLFMAVFSILSIRERRHFWSTAPSMWHLMALDFDLAVGISIGLFGFFSLPPVGWSTTVVLALSGVFDLIVNDFVKYGALTRSNKKG